MKIKKITALVTASLLLSSNSIYAFFAPPVVGGINFDNAAFLGFSVKNYQVYTGFYDTLSTANYTGRFVPFTGGAPVEVNENSQRSNVIAQYYRLAVRVRPDFVIGVDVTQPVVYNAQWNPAVGVIRESSYSTSLTSYDISPRFSYAIKPFLFFGGGLNVTKYSLSIKSLPPGIPGVNSSGQDWSVGWNLALAMFLSRSDILGVTYYSKRNFNLQGDSILSQAGVYNFSSAAIIPAELVFHYVHIFNDKFKLFNITYLAFTNSVKRLPSTVAGVNYAGNAFLRNSFGTSLNLTYDINKLFSTYIGGLYAMNPSDKSQYQTAAAPIYGGYAVGGGLITHISKSLDLSVAYLRGSSSKSNINTANYQGAFVPYGNFFGATLILNE